MNHVSNHEENKRECQFKSPSWRRALCTIKQADTSHSAGLRKKADEVLKAAAEKAESQSYRLLPPSYLTRPLVIASLLHCSNIA
jgi:hypothetical protein